jgi:gluconolactonase
MKNIHLLLFLGFSLLFACQPINPSEKSKLQTIGEIVRSSPEIERVLPADAAIEVLAEGFDWSEGPLWVPAGDFVLFSDIPPNKIMRWKEGEGLSLYLTPSGFTGEEKSLSGEPGSNGLLLDSQGNLVMCQHGDRRMAKMIAPIDQPKPNFSTLADRWNGKRFNSPNDATFDSEGNLWFTDPPYGLPGQAKDSSKEIPFQGVYRLNKNGSVELMLDSLTRPNGIAFSPDERTLYVANSDPEKAVWMAYDVSPEGALSNGRIFHEATAMVKDYRGLPDGLKVNRNGIIFATGPGGVWIFKPDGTVLGRLDTRQATSNCALGKDQKTLYITADMYLCRVSLL